MGSDPLATQGRMAVRAIFSYLVFHRSQGETRWNTGSAAAIHSILGSWLHGHCYPSLSNINVFDDVSTDFYPSLNSHMHPPAHTNKESLSLFQAPSSLRHFFFAWPPCPTLNQIFRHIATTWSSSPPTTSKCCLTLHLTTRAHQKRFHLVR